MARAVARKLGKIRKRVSMRAGVLQGVLTQASGFKRVKRRR